MSDKALYTIFSISLSVVIALACLPGVFDWANTVDPWVLGMPFASFWQLLLSTVGILIIGLFYLIEDKRGSLDYDVAED